MNLKNNCKDMFVQIDESRFFLDSIKKTDRVLEYGSGESTKEIASRCKELVSVEHQKNWYDMVVTGIPENVELLLKEPNLPYIEGTYNCGTYDEFEDYITCAQSHGKFDVIFIDGRARLECAKFCKNVSHENTLVFIHDFSSRLYDHGYIEVFKYLDLVESVSDMSKFKVKI
jgi:hypothetical protein